MPQPPLFAVVAVALVIIIAAGNAASTLLECGLTWCPEDPTRYLLLLGGG